MKGDCLLIKKKSKIPQSNFRTTCFLVFMFLGFQVCGCAQVGEESIQWEKFECSEDGFSISMPAQPERTDLLPRSEFYGKEDLTGAKQVQYVARYENSASYSVGYSVAVSIAPDSLKQEMIARGSFEDARRALISTTAGNIVREREIKYDGKYPGYEIEFEVPLNNTNSRGFKGITRMYIVGARAFHLKIVCMPGLNPSPKISEKDASDFFDSFRILYPE